MRERRGAHRYGKDRRGYQHWLQFAEWLQPWRQEPNPYRPNHDISGLYWRAPYDTPTKKFTQPDSGLYWHLGLGMTYAPLHTGLYWRSLRTLLASRPIIYRTLLAQSNN